MLALSHTSDFPRIIILERAFDHFSLGISSNIRRLQLRESPTYDIAVIHFHGDQSDTNFLIRVLGPSFLEVSIQIISLLPS